MPVWHQTYKVTGSPPIITEDKPGKAIEKDLAAIFARAIIDITGSEDGAGDNPIAIHISKNGPNGITIRASAKLITGPAGATGATGAKGDKGDTWYPPGGATNTAMVWNGRSWGPGAIRAQ